MESKTPACAIQQIPQEVLTLIFKYLPIAPERWYCLFVCKAFYNAMQSHLLWTHISLQDSSVIDKTEAPVWYEPWKLPGKKEGFAAHLTAPKRPYFMSANFLSYLKRCHREHVIELDLSYVPLINQEESEVTQVRLKQESTFWDLMFEFPNLRNLSLFGTNAGKDDEETRGLPNLVLLPPRYATWQSPVRNLNLLFSIFTASMRINDLAVILQHAPNLEIFQISVEHIMFEQTASFAEHANLKQVYFHGNNYLMDRLRPYFPNLELAIREQNSTGWIRKQGKATLIEPIEVHNIRELDLKKFEQDLQCITTTRFKGIPLLIGQIEWANLGQLRLLFKYLKFDINAKVRGISDTLYDPFVLPYTCSISYYRKLHPVEGDTALHFAVKLGKYEVAEFLLQHGADPNIQDCLLRTPIFYSQDVRTAQLLVKYGADPTLLDLHGWNTLMCYIAQKRNPHGEFAEDYENVQAFFAVDDNYEDHAFKDVEAFVELGCDLNHRTNDGLNLFKISLVSGNFFFAKHLLNVTKDAMKETSPCVGSLSCVVLAKNVSTTEQLEMIGILLQKGADPQIVDDGGQSYLHLAALRMNFDVLMAALTTAQNPAELLKLKDNAGYTCLHYLEPCQNWNGGDQSGYIEAVFKSMKKYEATSSTCTLEEFLQKVAELDCINVQATSGETPLLLCCRFTCEVRFYSVNKLIAHGADPNITDYDGVSPLIMVAYEHDYDVMTLLLKSGANVDHCDNKGIGPILAATLRFLKEAEVPNKEHLDDYCERFERILKLLLDNGADINQREKLCGFTVLHLLAMCKDLEIISTWIQKLVKRGAKLDARTHINETPLHRAIMQGNLFALKTLLELGADVTARGVMMRTPLHYALKYLDLSEIDFSSDRATLDGFKTVGNSIVRYPAWNWSSIDDFSQFREKNIEYFEAKHLTIFVELFRFADRIDFNAKNLQGEIPLHKAMIRTNFALPNLGVLQRIYVPLKMLEHSTKEQLLTKNSCGVTPLDTFWTQLRNIATWRNSWDAEDIQTVANKLFELAGGALTLDHLALAFEANVDITRYNVKGHNLLLHQVPPLHPDRIEPPIFTLFSKPMTNIEHFKRCSSLLEPAIWRYQDERTKDTILHRILTWWRNSDCEALLFNHVHSSMGGDRILLELLEFGADPHAKNIYGYSFADAVPEFDKIRANLPLLRGEEKPIISKPDYFAQHKKSQTDLLLGLVMPSTNS